MLKKFWSLSKKPFALLFLTDNIKLAGMPTKIKLKMHACFTLYFKFWEGASLKIYKMQLQDLLFFVSHQFLYQEIAFSYNFLEIYSALSEKDFCRKFFLFKGFTQTLNSLNSQNLPSMTKSFCQFCLQCLLNFFKKYLLTISCKSIYYVSAVNSYFSTFQLQIIWCSFQNIFQEQLF